MGEVCEGGSGGEMTKAPKQSEARTNSQAVAGQVLIVLLGARGPEAARALRSAASWRREGRPCEAWASGHSLKRGRGGRHRGDFTRQKGGKIHLLLSSLAKD